MQSVSLQKETPPWVEFKTVMIENRAKSTELGRMVRDPVDFVFIYPAGSKDCIEKNAADWLDQIKVKAMNGTFREDWARDFTTMYQRWKDGESEVLSGTPLSVLPGMGAAQVEQCTAARIRTVEALAGCNEGALSIMGMGGRELKHSAQRYLDTMQNGEQLLAQVEKLQAEVKAKDDMLVSMISRLEQLEAAAPKRGRPRKEEVDA